MSKLPTMDEWKDRLIARALEATGGNKMKAARLIGITPMTIYRREKEACNQKRHSLKK